MLLELTDELDIFADHLQLKTIQLLCILFFFNVSNKIPPIPPRLLNFQFSTPSPTPLPHLFQPPLLLGTQE